MSEYIVNLSADWASKQGEKLTEIVRCRDCRWAKPDHSDHEYRGEYRCNMWIADVDGSGFCFRAWRKESGE